MQWHYSVVPGLLGQQTKPQWSKSCTYHQHPVSDRLRFWNIHVGREDTALHFWPLHMGGRTDESYCRPVLHTPTDIMLVRSLNSSKTIETKYIILPKNFDILSEYLTVLVWTYTSNCGQLCAVPGAAEAAGVWTTGSWFTWKTLQWCSVAKTICTLKPLVK